MAVRMKWNGFRNPITKRPNWLESNRLKSSPTMAGVCGKSLAPVSKPHAEMVINNH